MTDQILTLDSKKQEMLSQVSILVDLRKAIFGHIDISQPKSIQEKEFDSKINHLFSEINKTIIQKRNLKP